MTLAATTEEKTRTEPIDRSMPEVMMTNVIPTPSTAQTATFWEISEKLEVDRNLPPAAIEKNATMTTQDPEDPHRLRFAEALQEATWWPSSVSGSCYVVRAV